MAANTRDKQSPDQILAQGFAAHGIPDLISDDDDDEVTRVMDVDEATESSRMPTMIPPRADEGDVYLLTKQHIRFKAGLVAPERVDLVEVMKAPSLPPESISERDTLDDLNERDTITRIARSTPQSLAPLAFDASVPPPARRRMPIAAVVAGALTVAAAALVLVPRAHQRGEANAAAQPAAVTQQAAAPIELAEVQVVAEAPVADSKVAELALVAITAPVPPRAAVEQKLADEPAPEPKLNEEAPSVAPAPAVAEAPEFEKSAANAALGNANRNAATCRAEGVPNFPYVISVTFAPNGKVTSAMVQGPPYAGTPTGSCIARTFRGASVPAFSGPNVTVRRAFELP